MRKYILSLCISIIALSFIFFSQVTSPVSIDSKFSGYYNIKPGIEKPEISETREPALPCSIININLTATVFGYLPSWKYETARNFIRYELLSHIAVFNFLIDEKGCITNPDLWPWEDVITNGHRNGVKIILTLFNSDSLQVHSIISDSTVKHNTFKNLLNSLIKYNLDGVNVDFELLKREDRGNGINQFMLEMKNFLHSELPGSEVSFAGPAVNWGGWDFKGLAGACDYIFIMGYDYYPQSSLVSGPSASLTGSYYSVESTLLNDVFGYGEVTRTSPQKLILGVPYFGNHWITEAAEAHSMNLQHVESISYELAVEQKGRIKRIWQDNYKVPWYRYMANGVWHQIWFDDPESIDLKYNFAISNKLKGVGMWALGFDGDRQELWNVIKRRFYLDSPLGVSKISMNNSSHTFPSQWLLPLEMETVQIKGGS